MEERAGQRGKDSHGLALVSYSIISATCYSLHKFSVEGDHIGCAQRGKSHQAILETGHHRGQRGGEIWGDA